jgi:hypothetical protein
MDQPANAKLYFALAKYDEALREYIWTIICERAAGSPYLNNGDAARSLSRFPPGLRAMAATHRLDLGRTIDSLAWPRQHKQTSPSLYVPRVLSIGETTAARRPLPA